MIPIIIRRYQTLVNRQLQLSQFKYRQRALCCVLITAFVLLYQYGTMCRVAAAVCAAVRRRVAPCGAVCRVQAAVCAAV